MTISEYLIKFSISLAGLYIFYRIVLRPLTFYQWNRFFLLLYLLLSFVIPFFNVTPWIRQKGMEKNELVNRIPSIGLQPGEPGGIVSGNFLMILFCIGALFMLGRLFMQYRSLRNIRRKSVLLNSDGNIRVYETDDAISPFSFGHSIFVNRRMHSETELQKILQHEIVHVKQRHTVDLVLGEVLCMINWYNPFAWLLRNAIRQNLEFIADHNVLAKGHDIKEYQYLLLKVIGIPQYSIVTHFNLPHLKKRIAMMNKIKSTKLHLTKFLFVLPIFLLLLLAFRSKQRPPDEQTRQQKVPSLVTDTVPATLFFAEATDTRVRNTQPNKKGYILSVADNYGECLVVIRDARRNIIKALTLDDWNNNKSDNENRYGKIPVAPKAPIPPAPPIPPIPAIRFEAVPAPPTPPVPAVTPPQPPSGGQVQIIMKTKDATMQADSIMFKLSAGEDAVVFSSSPLYMVDGRETTEIKAHSIPAAEIENISVTKGAAANTFYGKKGKNGVVEIRTKQKLYIVNGVEQPVNADVLTTTTSEDIESVNVLKDESATQKYGEKGRNGVIEIQTKKR